MTINLGIDVENREYVTIASRYSPMEICLEINKNASSKVSLDTEYIEMKKVSRMIAQYFKSISNMVR